MENRTLQAPFGDRNIAGFSKRNCHHRLMGKQRRIIFRALVVIATIVVLWAFLIPREPVYQGHKLSYWLDGYDLANLDSPGWEKADEAVRQIGVQAVPTLLAYMRARDSTLKQKALAWAQSHHWIKVTTNSPARTRNLQGMYGFQVLGPDASNAVPELMAVYDERISTWSQRAAISSLACMGPAAKHATPALVRATTNDDPLIRTMAMSALRSVEADQKVLVPALASRLKDTDKNVRDNAIYWLLDLGPDAKAAIPALQQLLASGDRWLSRPLIEAAIKRIDQDGAAPNPAVGK